MCFVGLCIVTLIPCKQVSLFYMCSQCLYDDKIQENNLEMSHACIYMYIKDMHYFNVYDTVKDEEILCKNVKGDQL
jgi:hypothetical protein